MSFGVVSQTWTDAVHRVHPQLFPAIRTLERYRVPGEEIDELVFAAAGKTASWDLHNKSMIPCLYVIEDGMSLSLTP